MGRVMFMSGTRIQIRGAKGTRTPAFGPCATQTISWWHGHLQTSGHNPAECGQKRDIQKPNAFHLQGGPPDNVGRPSGTLGPALSCHSQQGARARRGENAISASCCVDSKAAHNKAREQCEGVRTNDGRCTFWRHCWGKTWEKCGHRPTAAAHAAQHDGDAQQHPKQHCQLHQTALTAPNSERAWQTALPNSPP